MLVYSSTRFDQSFPFQFSDFVKGWEKGALSKDVNRTMVMCVCQLQTRGQLFLCQGHVSLYCFWYKPHRPKSSSFLEYQKYFRGVFDLAVSCSVSTFGAVPSFPLFPKSQIKHSCGVSEGPVCSLDFRLFV